jgi:hypothetical protein
MQRYVWPHVQSGAEKYCHKTTLQLTTQKNHDASAVKHCSAYFQHRLSQSNITTNLTNVEPGGSTPQDIHPRGLRSLLRLAMKSAREVYQNGRVFFEMPLFFLIGFSSATGTTIFIFVI